MRLTETSVFEILSWAYSPDGAWTFVDAGAHRGEFAARWAAAFPNSTVHAFEPAPDAFAFMTRRSLPRVRAWNAAVGAESRAVEFHVNNDDETSSILRPSANAGVFHGAAHLAQRVISVDQVRLDDWAVRERIGPVHAIKLDVQGAEVPAILGADRLLRESVLAVFSEAQFIPEYEGGSLFGDIDAVLRDRGFSLFQIVDVQPKGPLQETGSCDALWLRRDLIERFRAAPPRTIAASDASRFGAVFHDLASRARAVAIYGAGTHTRNRLVHALADCPARVVCVIDDNPANHGRRLWGFPIVSREGAIAMGADTILLSSDLYEHAMLERCRPLQDAGMEILCLYGADSASPARRSARLHTGTPA